MVASDFSAESLRVRALLMLINAVILLRYFGISASIFLVSRQEALTGQAYRWPISVQLMSGFVLLVSAVFFSSMIGMWRGNDLSKKLLVICLMLFALVECIETFMLHVRFNPIKLSEYDTYIYGPMLLIWAFVTWLVLRNRPKKADIHSS